MKFKVIMFAIVMICSPVTINAAERINLKIATFTPASSIIVKDILEPYLAKVRKASGNAFDYKIFAGGTLGRNPAEQLALVQSGIADIAFVASTYISGAYEEYDVTELPLLAVSSREASYGLWSAFRQGLLSIPENVKVITVWSNGPNGLHLKNNATGVADLRNVKIRAAGKIQAKTLTALGAVAIGNIRAPGVAENISRGVIDGSAMDWGAIGSFRVDRVTTSHLELPLGSLAIMLPINAKTWEKLPEKARAAFIENSGESFIGWVSDIMDRATTDILHSMREAGGHTIVPLSASDRAEIGPALTDIAENWAAESEQKTNVLNAYRKAIQALRN